MRIRSNEEGLELARTLARTSNHDYRIGAILCDTRGNILSMGVNKHKSHPVQAKAAEKVGMPKKIYLHAEVCALLNRTYGIPNKIYVARLKKHGKNGLAKPCKICSFLLNEAGVKNVFYTI